MINKTYTNLWKQILDRGSHHLPYVQQIGYEILKKYIRFHISKHNESVFVPMFCSLVTYTCDNRF